MKELLNSLSQWVLVLPKKVFGLFVYPKVFFVSGYKTLREPVIVFFFSVGLITGYIGEFLLISNVDLNWELDPLNALVGLITIFAMFYIVDAIEKKQKIHSFERDYVMKQYEKFVDMCDQFICEIQESLGTLEVNKVAIKHKRMGSLISGAIPQLLSKIGVSSDNVGHQESVGIFIDFKNLFKDIQFSGHKNEYYLLTPQWKGAAETKLNELKYSIISSIVSLNRH